ncbi:alpha-ketoglutarate-dependent dioxygenase AlkB [Acanthopleuribacter pedis]|uniref:Alpha-ketoglutarate-dependent dioxygenase AlkB n=1 Tax=Acanthopleuribacter pedis TaxID=442870 RepID=A0A8J7Q0P9_9BACT|nr:alpha-ketoglutarate-dependent dioxygenase AlkB [Acanthopleuribacter pedis]MBO1317085.1 alpha-ketoglutarate-dependent dioxygenase AlkB [Acanthopleuribacter pedis]
MQNHQLDAGHHIQTGTLPAELILDTAGFDSLWASRPADFHIVHMHGKPVPTPRWQQAYGKDYVYSGNINRALPTTATLAPFLAWARERFHDGINSLLLNWYDGTQGHYIGRHRDATAHMVPDSPIITVSLGEERIFRLRPYGGKGFHDVTLGHGAVVLIPFATNQRWTHEVPHFKRFTGRRISITLRAFI